MRFLSSSAIRRAKGEIPAFRTFDESFKIMKGHPIEDRLLRTTRTIYSCHSRECEIKNRSMFMKKAKSGRSDC